MKKTLLLDLDGTVTNSLKLIKQTYRKVFDKMSIPWQDEAVMKYIGIPLKEIGRIFAGESRIDEFYTTYQQYYHLEHDQLMECYPGVIEAISTAKSRGYIVGIVTSKSRRGTMKTLDFLGLTKLMDVIVTADDVTEHKPNPRPVLAALEQVNATPEEAVFVGDSPFDIRAGKAAKVKTVGVTWGMADEKLLTEYQPDFIVHSWNELTILLFNDAFFK